MGKRIWTDEQLVAVVSSASSRSEVLRELGLKILPGNYATINRAIRRLDLDVSHFQPRRYAGRSPVNKMKLVDVLVKGSTYTNTSRLKKRLIAEGLLKNVCAVCGQEPVWNGKPLVLILDHINGVRNDNRLENLRIICRHCDSQLETFAGRNVKDKRQYRCVDCGKRLVAKRVTGRCRLCLSVYRREQAETKGVCPSGEGA